MATPDQLREYQPVKEQFSPLQAAGGTDRGLVRERNEDTFRIAEDPMLLPLGVDGVYVVCDGVGEEEGKQASTVGAATFINKFTMPNMRDPSFLTLTPVKRMDIVEEAVEAANKSVHSSTNRRGASTLVAAVGGGNDYIIVHAGDSRAYTVSGNDIRRLTKDHTMAQLQVDDGDIQNLTEATPWAQNTLSRHLGQQDNATKRLVPIEPGMARAALHPGEFLLLCTNGLTRTGALTESEIQLIITTSSSPQVAVKRLIDATNQRGGPDNITAVVIPYRSPQPNSPELAALVRPEIASTPDQEAAVNLWVNWIRDIYSLEYQVQQRNTTGFEDNQKQLGAELRMILTFLTHESPVVARQVLDRTLEKLHSSTLFEAPPRYWSSYAARAILCGVDFGSGWTPDVDANTWTQQKLGFLLSASGDLEVTPEIQQEVGRWMCGILDMLATSDPNHRRAFARQYLVAAGQWNDRKAGASELAVLSEVVRDLMENVLMKTRADLEFPITDGMRSLEAGSPKA